MLTPLGEQSATGTSGHLLRQAEAFSLGTRNKKGGSHAEKGSQLLTAALFRVLNTLSDSFYAQYVPHGQFEAPCELHLLNVLRKGVVNVRYL